MITRNKACIVPRKTIRLPADNDPKEFFLFLQPRVITIDLNLARKKLSIMNRLLHVSLFFLLSAVHVFAQQPENPGFEEWEDAGPTIVEPVNWSSIKSGDDPLINSLAPVVWSQSTDAHSGSYSLELINVQSLLLATGTITNGRIHASLTQGASNSYTDPDDSRWNTPITSRPDSIAVWIKYFPIGNDTAQVKAVLHVGEGTLPPTPENQGNWIAYAQIDVWETVEEWTRVVAPFTYYSEDNPAYALMVMTSGAGLQPVEGSIVRFDDVEFVYDPAGIYDMSLSSTLIYTYGMEIYLTNLPESFRKGAQMELINLSGTIVGSMRVSGDRVNMEGTAIKPGLYVVRIKGKEGTYAQKIQLR
jgi:hypothetical protein